MLDTCTFLWLAEDDPQLSRRCRALFQDPDNTVYLSPASGWEIALKHALGKLPLQLAPQQYVPKMRALHRIQSLPLKEDDALHAGGLPLLHRDPFDRMLIGQAICQGCTLLTPDPLIAQYSVQTDW